MRSISKLVNDFIGLLTTISQKSNGDFSGVGLVLYESLESLSNYHCNLVNDQQQLPALQLGTEALVNYLLTIADYQHPYHDGFHFINNQGQLTHVAQFLSPPVYKLKNNNTRQGARTFCSQCGSNIPGVVLVGAISSTQQVSLFHQGNRFMMSKQNDKQSII